MFKVKDNIHYTGRIDWDLRKFHGDQMSTNCGSTYNSFLIEDEKKVLIDTVWHPYADEFISRLASIVNPKDIDCLIVTHAEPDHSSSMVKLLDMLPGLPVYCSKSGVKSITGHFHKEYNFQVVKTGDKLNIGKKEITFIEAPFLHWPDTMMCHLSGDNVLFSSDVFGQHFAASNMFAGSSLGDILTWEAMKYYANIVAPYSPKVLKKLHEVKGLGLPIDMICPAHGLIWDENPGAIIDLYEKWADSYAENQVTVIYETMYNSTKQMAEKIAEGIVAEKPDINVKVFSAPTTDLSDLMTEVFRSKGVLIGSPTHNNGMMPSIASLLEEIEGMELKGKKGAAFGSYGWADKASKKIADSLTNSGFTMMPEPLKCQWAPDEEFLRSCVNYGREFAKAL